MGLLTECEYLYDNKDFKNLIKISDEVLKKDKNNPIAISYKAIAYCFLNQPEKSLEILNHAAKIHLDNYYHKNIAAMAYYDLGDYENSLKCCNHGLRIKKYDWLYENKIKALLKLDRFDEAVECFEIAPWTVEITDLLVETEKYSEAMKYCCEKDLDEFNPVIDKIKHKDSSQVGEFYISWIYKIRYKFNTRFCPECGGELVPIVWGFPSEEMLDKHERGEIFLGGCCIPPNEPNYHCKNCNSEFDLGCEGLYIECEDYLLYDYIEYKIREFISKLKTDSKIIIRSLETLKKELKGYDDREFSEFINHLKDLDYICEPCKGYIKLAGFDDLQCMKEYCDDDKYAAPPWLVYPNLSAWTIGWRMGCGENYSMNFPGFSKEFDDLFPMPKYWQFSVSKSPYKPHPILSYFWNENGKPKYLNNSKAVKVNDFITLDDEKEFRSDTFRFKSIRHALLLSKAKYFKKYTDDLKNLEFSEDEEKIWDIYRYSVLLNAAYFKILQDEKLKQKLLETDDEPLIYVSEDSENLFGRALMEIRDEIRRLYQNADKIDWEYTEYLKYVPWQESL